MKRSAAACGLLASLVPLTMMAGNATAQGVGDLYWGVFGAAQFYSDNEVNGADLNFDPGWAVGGNVGYIFGSVRAEAEIEYNEADVKSFGNRNQDDSGTISALRGPAACISTSSGSASPTSCPMPAAVSGWRRSS